MEVLQRTGYLLIGGRTHRCDVSTEFAQLLVCSASCLFVIARRCSHCRRVGPTGICRFVVIA